jgi:hypothetical protein
MASGDTLMAFMPENKQGPGAGSAPFDVRNDILVLAFDGGTSEAAIFRGILPKHYAGGGLTLEIWWMTIAVTGDVVWGGSISRAQAGGADQDAYTFATEQLSAAATADATAGKKVKSTITFSSGANMDGLQAGEPFFLRVQRKTADAGDTMSANDAQLVEMHLAET